MAITRPTGEQLSFVSSKTGTHVLDDYMEAAEKGDRQLADLLADIFDESGNLKPGYLEFQVTSAGMLQYRVAGVGAWTDLQEIFKYKGTWAPSTTYKRTNTVTESGVLYICVADHTSDASLFSNDSAYWVVGLSLAGNPVYFKGTFDASIGSYPASPGQGDLWVASVAGTISSDVYDIGDMALYNGSAWEKIESNANDRVLKSGDTMTGTLTVNNGSNSVEVTTDGSIELRRAAGGAYIDWRTGVEDYKVRLVLSGAGEGLETVDGSGAQYGVGFKIGETTHATSNTARLGMGNNWFLMQDTQGDGNRDFGLYNVAGFFPVRFDGSTGDATWTKSHLFQLGITFSQQDFGTVSTSQSIYGYTPEFVKITLAASVSILSDASSGNGYGKTIKIVQGTGGGFTPTFTGATWIGAEPDWPSRAAGAWDYVSLIVTPDGDRFVSHIAGSA